MNKDKLGKALAAGAGAAAAAAVAATTVAATKKMRRQQEEEIENVVQNRDYGDKQVYFVGGGIASLAGAAYLVRDANFKGKNIHILEGMDILGGSNDGIGTPEKGFVCRGGRMLNEETYENFWDLFSSIPSLDNPDRDVTTEILNFDHAHPTHARARLIDKDGKILDVYSMGFNNEDRMAMARLLATPEKDLDNLTIEDWFNRTPHFFETNFWYMWQTTFAFQKWSSLFELKRYMEPQLRHLYCTPWFINATGNLSVRACIVSTNGALRHCFEFREGSHSREYRYWFEALPLSVVRFNVFTGRISARRTLSAASRMAVQLTSFRYRFGLR